MWRFSNNKDQHVIHVFHIQQIHATVPTTGLIRAAD